MNKIVQFPWTKHLFNLCWSGPSIFCLLDGWFFFFCAAKTTFNTFAECFVFSLSSDVSQHQKLNQQRCLVSQRVDALGRWNKIIKIIRLTKNVAVTNGFFSSFFWEFTFQAGKNLKLDANETVRKDYRKAIKVTLKFVSTSAIFFLNVFPSKIFIQWNGQGLHRFKCILAKYTEITECIGKMRIIFFF